MEKFTPEEAKQAKEFGEFFIDLIENHKESLVFYLSDNAVLDWFGHTIKTPKNIGSYLKTNPGSYSHQFGTAVPVRKIGHRDTHVIKFSPEKSKKHVKSPITTRSATSNNEVTPPKLKFSPSSETHFVEKGQGDGPHNCEMLESPRKKCRLDLGQGDSTITDSPPQLKYISAEGSIEFRKKSQKKLQQESKWNRPCKLEVGYSATNFQDCTIYMIIYQGNMKCRRNLLKDFEKCESSEN